MSLVEQINKKRREIKTDGYPMSIGEWVSMYEREELDIHPEFQRFYRWTSAQKAGLIESILLGIPLPQIFVSQRSDGVWDVVDGLQRLSTIFQFMGILRDEDGQRMEPLALEGTKYLPALNGVLWESADNPRHALPKELQLVIKRSKIAASIVLKESDESAKYDLFQRLNTGGSELSPQEVRNCLLVMINKSFFEWLKELPRYEPFIATTALSDRPLEEAYDVELALRFIILARIPEVEIKSIGDVGIFLTDRVSEVAQNKRFRRGEIKQLFEDTFDVLAQILEDEAFKRYSIKKKRHEGGFLLSMFEVVALGVAYNIAEGTLCEQKEIPKRARSIWSNKAFTDWATSGVNASRRLPRLIPLGRKLFSNAV
ncbi:hypothetical protein WK90_21595 [Burkholderia cepacia]|uniref:DUF262 domain-containing protein n=1 Tax=Burkholderia reimsis TaxID=2234132 RepID=A0A365QLE7_9BURK|nr:MULTISPECIES: DUF262 domain-containing protein [Burkholderia]KVV51099.1 hypothetical protein WK83_31110 [Burkholderia cepacia]KVV61150.1 hypothetical protein WK84_05135 [Burkholderia cepacia]KVV74983.1 hypothetical protein WK85_09495 [Burkholderia cepacia]KVV81436.1 hypothetical protein WK87_26790 [Burkholderia cepacia]KVV84369.1 hypothetical protein WK86_14675 [Burkholderia cepacia]